MIREGLPGKVTFEHRPVKSKGMSYMDVRGKRAQSEGNSKHRGPEANVPGVFKKTAMNGTHGGSKEESGRRWDQKDSRGQVCRAL